MNSRLIKKREKNFVRFAKKELQSYNSINACSISFEDTDYKKAMEIYVKNIKKKFIIKFSALDNEFSLVKDKYQREKVKTAIEW